MIQRLRATTERFQRSVARVVRSVDAGFATAAMFATAAWNGMPSVHPSAICTCGKYHTRRLQEMHT